MSRAHSACGNVTCFTICSAAQRGDYTGTSPYSREVRIRRQFDVPVRPEEAFEFFSDPNRAFERLASAYRVTWSGPIATGARFRLDAPDPNDSCDGILDASEPPVQLAFRLWVRDHPDRGGTATYRFEPTEAGTRVDGVAETHMSRTLEIAAALLRPFLALQARRGTRKLVGAIEAAHQTTRASDR